MSLATSVDPPSMEIHTEGCVLHPRRRRIRHLRGLHLRNITLDTSSHNDTHRTPTKVRSDTKDMIGLNTPVDRQRYLQSINSSKFLNVFYSLHYDNYEVFYVSEVRDRCLDADFQEFRLDTMKGGSKRKFKLKVWASKFGQGSEWRLLLDYTIDMKCLLFWDTHLENVKTSESNAIIIELFDGVYVLPLGIDQEWYKSVCVHDCSNHKAPLESLSFDSLMKLNGLEMGIEDMRISKSRLEEGIKEEMTECALIDTHRVDQLQKTIQMQKDINDLRREKLEELKELKRQKELQLKKLQRETKYDGLSKMKDEFAGMLVKYENTLQDLVIERSKVIKTVISIFPKSDIEQWLECKEFEILPNDLSLKNMTDVLNASDPKYINEINAGFGYICHMISLLSRYLAVPLRYHVQPFGSSSYVIDRISQINQRTVFPLFYTSHFLRFQYGVMLLNTNIHDILDETFDY